MIDEEDIPENWDLKTIDEICGYIQRGKQPDYDDENGRVNIINQRCIYWDGLNLENVRKLDREHEEKWQEYRYLQKGDVLVNSTGVGTLGRAQIWDIDTEKDYVVDGHVTILRANEEVKPEYLFQFLKSPLGQGQIDEYTRGSTGQTELYKKHITSIDVPIPPLEDQENIVEWIGENLESVDELLRGIHRIDGLTEEYEDSLLAFLFSGKHNLSNDSAEYIPSEEDIPDHWELKIVEDIIENAKNGGTPKRSQDEYWNGDIDWLSSGEVTGKEVYTADESITEKGLKETSAKLFPKDSILVAMYGATRGQSTILREEMSGNQAICCLEIDESEVLVEYVLYYFKHIKPRMVSEGRGGGQKNINQSVILNQEIPVPPLDEQREIVERIEAVDMKQVERAVKDTVELLNEYKDSILSRAFVQQPRMNDNSLSIPEA